MSEARRISNPFIAAKAAVRRMFEIAPRAWLRLRGRVGAFRRCKFYAATIAVFGVISAIVATDVLFPPPLSKAEQLSTLIVDREGRWVHAFATDDGLWRYRANLDEIDPAFLERLVAVEDKRFWSHWGVDGAAIARALISNIEAREFVSGASTITMQTARLLEPRPRNLGSKLVEMFRALQIERRLSKREVLGLYLTLAPYGGNIEGVRAASLVYFGKEPSRLTDAEQALLIALPQAPEARRPDRRADAAREARADILRKFVFIGSLDEARAVEAEGALVPSVRADPPRAAYHIALELARVSPKSDAVVHSTLDLLLQEQAEALVKAHVEGITDGATAALIIVDNETRSVRAAVGSSGLDAEGGWIDLTNAIRSPGSTLKPFIYGMAFDDGLVGPNSVIDDMPQSFDGYTPENFDRTFRGEVRASEALQYSLNLPAVRLLNELGAQKLAALLRAAGVAIAGPNHANGDFGLTLALGGAGVTMRDLAVLYAGLANGGAVRPLVWTMEAEGRSAESQGGFQMFSPDSAARISSILADAPALEGRAPSSLSESAPAVAYKTGTSYGYRDAWAAGHGGGYTVVAWMGRADGASRPGETGRKAAAPLLMDAFDMLARFDPKNAAPAPLTEQEPTAIARLAPPRREAPPEIIFPRDGVELFGESFDADARGFSLAARGGAGGYRWYVGGDPVMEDAVGGRPIWRPSSPGFYEIVVVDVEGRTARAMVRVASDG
jgi:penicillin-binding protein 1C